MGSTAVTDVDYALLQQRLDRNSTGAPDSPSFQKILRLLFTPEEARLARQIPQFISVSALARRAGVAAEELDGQLTEMARKGLVIDIEADGRRFVSLSPVVIGLYEFTFMRAPDESTQELAELFDEYFEERAFPEAIFRGSTQIGRSLVREESLPEDRTTEVLEWERATALVRDATDVAVSRCPCRTHAHLLGRGCDAPTRTCLTLNGAVDSVVRTGMAERITNEEGLEILAQAKAAGLAQTADNVQQDVTYICNCCGCCCGMMTSIKRFDLPHGIVSSNWIAAVDHGKCRGCGRCVKACPAGALTLELTHGKGLRRNWAVLDTNRCLGCGVCHDVCRNDAHSMEARPRRVFTPESTLERVAAMAIERGKLGDLLLDQVDSPGGRAVARILHVLEQTPPARALRAVEPLRSTFLKAFVAGMKRGAPSGADTAAG